MPAMRQRGPHAARPAHPRSEDAPLAQPSEQIAAEVDRRPIGAVIRHLPRFRHPPQPSAVARAAEGHHGPRRQLCPFAEGYPHAAIPAVGRRRRSWASSAPAIAHTRLYWPP
jgi:hypothetical protein